MCLRRKNKKYRGVGYSYWHLCETTRTARGPRQRVVASLGRLDEAQIAGLRGGWADLPALLCGEAPAARSATLELPGLDTPPPRPAQWEQADVRGLRVERTRDFGESYLGLALWHRLKGGRKRMLVFLAMFSLITAIATFAFGAMSFVSKGSLWTSIFLLSLGIIFLYSRITVL